MNKPFYIINTSRGKIINTHDLIGGIQSKKILGAALDVHESEDQTFNKLDFNQEFNYLLNCENVILTPHIAGLTKESNKKLSSVLIEKNTSIQMKKNLTLILLFTICLYVHGQEQITNFIYGASEILINDTETLIEGYMSPVGKWFGSGLNAGWYNTGKTHQFQDLMLLQVFILLLPKATINISIPLLN